MLSRGRILAKIARWGESRWRPPSLQNPWRFTVGSRALSLRKPFPFAPTLPKLVPSNDTDINLIQKRFLNGGNNRSSNEESSFSSKLFAAFGVLLGVCSGASAYHVLMNVNKDNIFGVDYFVACEPENTCKEEPCVEKTCTDSVCLRDRTRECLEEKILRANGDLELALVDTKIKAIDYTEAAIEAYCEAMVDMRNYLDVSYNLLANDDLETDPCKYTKTWCVVYKSAKKRCANVRDALEKGQVAWELLCRLREVIESGKACQFTAANPLLPPVEEALGCAEKELLAKKTELEAVYSAHPLVKKYKSGIESFRKELREDVYAKYDQEWCDEIKYVEQEMALMIEQAYIRLIQVHKQWAKSIACKGWKRSPPLDPPPTSSLPNFGETNPEDEVCEDVEMGEKDENGDVEEEGDEEEDDDDEEMCEEDDDEEEICEEDEDGEETCEIVKKVKQEQKPEVPEEEEDLSYEGPPLEQVMPPIPALPERPCAGSSPTAEEDENKNEIQEKEECDCDCDKQDEEVDKKPETLEEDCEDDEEDEDEDDEEEECEDDDEEE